MGKSAKKNKLGRHSKDKGRKKNEKLIRKVLHNKYTFLVGGLDFAPVYGGEVILITTSRN